MKSNLQRADQVLVPYSLIKITNANRSVEVPIIDSVPVGDYSTLHISATPSLISFAAGAEATSAVVIIVRFTEAISYGGVPSVSVVGGGRDLCVGALDIGAGGGCLPSSLDVRLPVVSQFVSVSYACHANQTNVNGLFFTAMLSTEPTNSTFPKMVNPGYYYDNLTLVGADSILGANYARNGLVLNAYADYKFVEFTQQTIGKLSITVNTTKAGATPINAGEIIAYVVTKAWDDNGAGTVDQPIWFLPQITNAQATGIPLV